MKFYLSLALFGILSAQSVFAKIGDCPIVYEGDIGYRSHSDHVEAFVGKDIVWNYEKWDRQKYREHLKRIEERKILWHTELLERDNVENPHQESDVQWNITCVEHIIDNNLIVSDKRGRRFTLDKNTGKLLKTNRYDLLYSAVIDEEYPVHPPKDITQLQSADDRLFILKRIDYIDHSLLIIHKDPNEKTDKYDIVMRASYDNYYLLSAQNLEITQNILHTFEKDKPIDITKWQIMNNKEYDDWYVKKYIVPKLRKIREQ